MPSSTTPHGVRARGVHGDRNLASVLHALANRERLDLVQAIAAGHLGDGRESPEGLTISRMAAALEISRFSASRHLGILRAAGVLDVQLDGPRALHTLNETAFDGLEDWLYAVLDGVRPGA